MITSITYEGVIDYKHNRWGCQWLQA